MTESARLLVVDDDRHVRDGLRELLEAEGYAVGGAPDGKTALDAVALEPPDLVLLDLGLPRVPGMEVLRRLAAEYPAVTVVVVSGQGGVPEAVEAVKLGAYDFLQKPVDPGRAVVTVRNALDRGRREAERRALLDDAEDRYGMVGTSPAMQAVYRMIERAAAVPSKVLVTGESGTGKELVARAIHRASARSDGPFVAVNCAALPDDLVESELFGHERGAFTGAVGRREGAFEQASGGTLFLDEIGDMGLSAQAKVLRALEGGRVRRVGGTEAVAVDARVIAATNKDLRAEVEAGRFREDLYYRLNVVTIALPSLCERRADVPALAEHVLRDLARQGHPEQTLDRDALSALKGADWPGNVRQLRNVVERAAVAAEGTVIGRAEARVALGSVAREEPEDDPADLRAAREAFERAHIRRVLAEHGGRVQESAAALGIDRSHLWKKMQRLGIGAS